MALGAGILILFAGILVPNEYWEQLLAGDYLQNDFAGFFLLTSIYTLAIVLMAPLSPFALAAGLLFGFWWGTFLALFALNVGAALAYFLARSLLRRQVSEQMAANHKMALVAKALRGDEVRTIAVLRLNPIVPFNLQNYVCGATGVRFPHYAAGTFLGAAPFTVALVFLGAAGRQLVDTTGLDVSQWTMLLFVFGLVLTVPLTWAMLRKTIRRLREYRNNDNTVSRRD